MMRLFFLFCLISLLFSSCGSGEFNIAEEGGTRYTIESSPRDFLERASGNTRNEQFINALNETSQSGEANGTGFIANFIEKLYASGSTNPASIFAVGDPSKYNHKMGKDELSKKLQSEYSMANDRVEQILISRLNRFALSKLNVYKNREGRIIVEVGDVVDVVRLRKLLTASADLGFYETYDNATSYAYLEKANEILSQLMYPDIDSLKETFGEDSLKEFQYMKYPLFKYLQLSLQQGEKNGYYFEKGCRIGLARVSDTSAINQLLRKKELGFIFPPEMVLAWGIKREDNNEGKALISLYTIKTNRYGPALNGRVVTDARVDIDGARSIITLTMNSEGGDQWKEITRQNTGHAIAIVLDGKVASAPTVENTIPNGVSVISGGFSVDEARDLANILKAGSLPLRVRIIDEQKVKPK